MSLAVSTVAFVKGISDLDEKRRRSGTPPLLRHASPPAVRPTVASQSRERLAKSPIRKSILLPPPQMPSAHRREDASRGTPSPARPGRPVTPRRDTPATPTQKKLFTDPVPSSSVVTGSTTRPQS
eukprot:PhF_6_TR40221/c0_g1_i2/m.59765